MSTSYVMLATVLVGWLMVAAGISKRQLAWRPRKPRRRVLWKLVGRG
jgi:hypothetical protein